MSIAYEIEHRLFERLEYIRCEPLRILYLSKHLKINDKKLAIDYPAAEIIHSLEGVERESLDLVIIHQYLPWVAHVGEFFKMIYEKMRPGGCLLFSGLGPDSFIECDDFFPIDHYLIKTHDIHPIGDLLLSLSFENPVMDREHIEYCYANALQMADVLCQEEMIATFNSETLSLITASPFCITYEVFYGHAWKPMTTRSDRKEVYVPFSLLKKIEKTQKK